MKTSEQKERIREVFKNRYTAVGVRSLKDLCRRLDMSDQDYRNAFSKINKGQTIDIAYLNDLLKRVNAEPIFYRLEIK